MMKKNRVSGLLGSSSLRELWLAVLNRFNKYQTPLHFHPQQWNQHLQAILLRLSRY